MAFNFTDPETKKITSDIILLPILIQGVIDQKAAVEASQGDIDAAETNNKTFFDHYLNVIDQYNNELLPLNGDSETLYDEQDLIDSAPRNADLVHFPHSPIWLPLQPKVLLSNTGEPDSNSGITELTIMTPITANIAQLKTGYSDGAIDTTASIGVAGGTTESAVGGFVAGQDIVIDQAGVSLIANITSTAGVPTVGAQVLTYTVLAGTETGLGVGARIRNSHPGFNNAEREGTSTPDAQAVLDYWAGLIDTEIALWETNVADQKTAVDANDAIGSEASEILAAQVSAQGVVDDIDTWQAAPTTGAGVGRYGDTLLATIEAQVTARTTEHPLRLAEITAALGTLSQNPDGTFSGAGNYFKLFGWVNKRINTASGSLGNSLRQDIPIQVLDQQAIDFQDQLDEYELIFSSNATDQDIASDDLLIPLVGDISGLQVGNTVLLMDNNSSVFTRTIDAIFPQSIQIDTSLGTNLLVNDVARVAEKLN
jgi:hypothetical protein